MTPIYRDPIGGLQPLLSVSFFYLSHLNSDGKRTLLTRFHGNPFRFDPKTGLLSPKISTASTHFTDGMPLVQILQTNFFLSHFRPSLSA